MPKVTFLPWNVTCEGRIGDSILDVAIDNEIPLQHNCGGNCACSTCHVIIVKGEEDLPEGTDEEYDQLDEAEGLTIHSRLGCQCKLLGANQSVVVEIPGANPDLEEARRTFVAH